MIRIGISILLLFFLHQKSSAQLNYEKITQLETIVNNILYGNSPFTTNCDEYKTEKANVTEYYPKISFRVNMLDMTMDMATHYYSSNDSGIWVYRGVALKDVVEIQNAFECNTHWVVLNFGEDKIMNVYHTNGELYSSEYKTKWIYFSYKKDNDGLALKDALSEIVAWAKKKDAR